MKTTENILKLAVLLALLAAAVWLVLSEPAADSADWERTFVLTKAAGLACGWLFWRLQRRWNGGVITKVKDWCYRGADD